MERRVVVAELSMAFQAVGVDEIGEAEFVLVEVCVTLGPNVPNLSVSAFGRMIQMINFRKKLLEVMSICSARMISLLGLRKFRIR